jgi:SulP family sulfate permease
VTVVTHDLAMGVLGGRAAVRLLLRAQGRPDASTCARRSEDDGRTRTYRVFGQVFFASADRFAAFDYKEVIENVRIDVSRAHFWDITAISALDKVVMKFRREGTTTEVIGLNEASATMIDRFAVHDKPGANRT